MNHKFQVWVRRSDQPWTFHNEFSSTPALHAELTALHARGLATLIVPPRPSKALVNEIGRALGYAVAEDR